MPLTGARSLAQGHWVMIRDCKKLVDSDTRIAQGRQRLAQHEVRIAEPKGDGQSTEDAAKLLQEIKETLRLTQQHRDQLLRKHRHKDGGKT